VTNCPVNAIEYRVNAYISGDRQLTIENGGPFPILQ
jgi:hypothetical protein